MGSLARVLGPSVGGLLYTYLSPKAPFLISAVVLFLATFLARRAMAEYSRPSGA
jgi:MFS family permease